MVEYDLFYSLVQLTNTKVLTFLLNLTLNRKY